ALWSAGAAVTPGAEAGRDGAIGWFLGDIPVPFFNQAFVLDAPADEAALRRAVDRLRSHDRPYQVRVRAGLDDALLPLIADLGLVEDPEEAYPAMALSPIPEDVETPSRSDELEILLASDVSIFEDHVVVVAEGFGMPLELVRRFLRPQVLEIAGTAMLVGYRADEPVATAMGFVADGTVGVYNVATIESARRRGYGAALTRRAIDEGRRRGAAVAILQSSTMGRSVYEAIGFRETAEFRVFVERPAG
ncbi:MAG TPA: GNAT family N-acetyltransferase, partial [Candidatus Limnocylindrales bacterium]